MSANGLSVLGQKPAAGRDFTPEDVRPGATPVAILTYPLWEDRYGKDPSLIGKIVRVDEVPTAVIGVTPPGVILAGGNDLWLPLIPTADFEKRGNRTLLVLGRLAEHANLRSANAEMQTIARALEREYPVTNKNIGALVQNMADAHLNRRAKSLLRALLGSVGFLLLIACANVANLLLARAVARSREISIRWAVGAGRWRLIRQLMMESLLLAAAGGLIGWLLAVWGVHAFVAALTRIEKMPALDFSMDQTVLLYLVAISAGTGLLFGLAPALRLSRLDVNAALKNGGRGAAGGLRGRSLSGLLVMAEMALAVVLLMGAGVMIRSVMNIARTPTGVNPSNVLTMSVDLPSAKYPLPGGPIEFQQHLKGRLESVPGVESVAFSSGLPGNGWMMFAPSIAYELEGAPIEARKRPRIDSLVIGPDYFRVLEVRPAAGRAFTAADGAAGVPVMIVNQACA
ncbi:MAG: ABC transporter permease, partial [Bryobacteraceae bacterium]